MLRGIGGLVLIFTLAGCGSTAPTSRGPLQLTVVPTQTLVGSASTADFTMRLQNVSPSTVTLNFTTSCQVMPYVVARNTGQVVFPPTIGWDCAAVITNLTLAPGEAKTDTVHFIATGESRSPYYPIPPGDYAVYARLEDITYRLESDRVGFTIR